MKTAAALVTLALLAVAPAGDAQEPTTVRLTMHNDAGFYFLVDGGTEKNPDLHLAPGTYRFQVENKGSTTHDFHLGDLGATQLLGPGESETLTVTIQQDAAVSAYWCQPHRTAGMVGKIILGGAGDSNDKGSPSLPLLAALGALALVAAARRR